MFENPRYSNSSSAYNKSRSMSGSSIMFNVPTIMSVYFVGSFLSIVGNALVCWIVKRNSSMHTSINYLLVNLAVADLLVTLFSFPAMLADAALIDIPREKFICKVQKTSFRVCHRSSIFTLIVIAHNRYQAICRPLKNLSPKYRIRYVISLIWFLSITSTTPLFVYCGVKVYRNNFTVCDCLDMFPTKAGALAYTIYSIVVDYAVSGIIIALFYAAIILKLRHLPPGQSRTCPAYQARRSVIKMLFVSFICFIVSWTPVYVIYMLAAFKVDTKNVNKFVFYPALLLGFGNAAYNPIIYCFLSKNFREGFKAALCCRRPLLRNLTRTMRTSQL